MKKILKYALFLIFTILIVGSAVLLFFPKSYQYIQDFQQERKEQQLSTVKNEILNYIEKEKKEVDDLNVLAEPQITSMLTQVDTSLNEHDEKQLAKFYTELKQLVLVHKKERALALFPAKLDQWLAIQKDIAKGILNHKGEPNTDSFPNTDYYEYLTIDKIEVIDSQSINLYMNETFNGYSQAMRETTITLVQYATSELLFDNKKIFSVTIYNHKNKVLGSSNIASPTKINWR